MLCKVTLKNQITLPKEIMRQFGAREYFDARVEDGRIILQPMVVRPVVSPRLAAIRAKIGEGGLVEQDASGLVDEARHSGSA